MAKDPAFLFYSSDFLTGTLFMTDAQVGKYMRLLCAQHQHDGFINKEAFNQIVGDDKLLRSKFSESTEGFFNKRLFDEMQKRKQKSIKMSANAKQKQSKSFNKYQKNDAIALQIENENENEDVIEIKDKGVQGEKEPVKNFAWYKSQFDEAFLSEISMIHRGKDVEAAILQSWAHMGADKRRLAASEASDCKKLLNTWLTNQKINQTKKINGIEQITAAQQRRNALIAAKFANQSK